MRRFRFIVLLAAIPVFCPASQVKADPLMLSLSGFAFGVPVNSTTDVTNGFEGVNLQLTNTPIGALTGNANPAPGTSLPIDSSFTVFAHLSGLDGDPTRGATVVLSGPIHGTYSQFSGNPNLDGAVSGGAVASTPALSPGAELGSVPAWFTGLTATVYGRITGGYQNLLQSNLTITPGLAAAQTQAVPEPSAFAVVLAGLAGLGLYRRRARRAS